VKGGSTTSIEVETIEVETRHLYRALASTPARSPQPTQEVGTELPGRPSLGAGRRSGSSQPSLRAKRSRECSKNCLARTRSQAATRRSRRGSRRRPWPPKPECGRLYCVVRSTRPTVDVVARRVGSPSSRSYEPTAKRRPGNAAGARGDERRCGEAQVGDVFPELRPIRPEAAGRSRIGRRPEPGTATRVGSIRRGGVGRGW
jgi:hypothetical protein